MKICLCTSHHSNGGIAQVEEELARIFDLHFPMYQHITYRNDLPGPIAKLDFARAITKPLLEGAAVLFSHPHLARIMTRNPMQSSDVSYGLLTHGLELDLDHKNRLAPTILEADLVMANSKQTSDKVKQKYGREEVIQAYYPGQFPTVDLNQRSPSEAPTVLMVGRMASEERYKGHDEVIRAWAQVLEVMGDAQLRIVGRGDDQGRLSKLASEICPNSSIRFLGHLTPSLLRQEYQKAWVFCMPSRGEGQGLVYLEALQHALPVIALKESPASEIITDRKEGLLVDANRPKFLSEAIITLLQSREMREEMTQAAKSRYEELNVAQRFEQTIVNAVKEMN